MFNIVRYRAVFFLLSIIVISGGLFALFLGPGIKWSIEFTSGAAAQIVFVDPASQDLVENALEIDGFQDFVVQAIGDREFFIRFPIAENSETQQAVIGRSLAERVGPLESYGFDLVSPVVASETVRNGLIAVLIATLGILAYIVFAFRGVPHSFRYGIAAIIALVHDIAIAFAIAGIAMWLFSSLRLELSTMFLIGVLTLIGYSINDTIVVFDRVRENLLRDGNREFSSTVNLSILEVMGRSLNTSFTTALVLVSLWLLGPTSIRDFLFIMMVGVVAGTYSSIFTASQVLVSWQVRSFGSLPTFGNRQPEP
jgi:preprotein translocase subunit SecF